MNNYEVLNFAVTFLMILKNLLVYAIIGRVLLSWFSMNATGTRGRFSQFLYDVTDPVINLAKKLPHTIAMIDLSPLIAIFALDLLGQLLLLLVSKLV